MAILGWKLHWQIALALGVAALTAVIIQGFGIQDSDGAVLVVSVADFIGQLFIRALQMIVVPLILASIISGVINIGGERDFGRLGLKTIGYYTLSGGLAVITGLVIVNLMRPGIVDIETAASILGQTQDSPAVLERVEGRGSGDLWDIFLRMIPPNIFEAASSNGQMLGIIFFSLLYGFFAGRLPEGLKESHSRFWEAVQEVMIKMTDLIIRFAPIGVVGLVTPILVRTGFDLFIPLLWFFATVIIALAIHFFVNLGLMLKYIGKIDPRMHYRAMLPVMLTAFSTSSSASTLPLTLETVEREAGVSKRVSSFTLPLGATVNMDGTALYECVVVIFIAQLFGVVEGFQLTFIDQILIVVLALLTSIGVAGIPAASLVAIVIILDVVGLPIEAIGVIWVTDRILDMCRTSVNVFSDTCGAAIIGRSEGEATIYPSRDGAR